jgi:hypothetical protein
MNYTGFGKTLVILAIVCGIVGWALIQLIIWLFSFITISIA